MPDSSGFLGEKRMRNNVIFKINPEKIDSKKIKIAARSIRQGKLVAFPTETVYGLGSDVFNARAVLKIFKIKGRPGNDPLIVHISEKETLFNLAKEIPEEAMKLIDEFWPGPLTVVLKKSNIVPDIVTAGLDTVAIRMPKNSIALNLIKFAGTPVAAPSANLFGRPSPTCAQHVIDDLTGKVDIILDGGRTEIGLESTVVDMTRRPFRILRPGGITMKEIRRLLGKVELNSDESDIIRSPGVLPHHYSPKAKLLLVEKGNGQINEMKRLALNFKKQGKNIGIMVTSENQNKFNGFKIQVIGSINDSRTCAFNLFSILRSFDKEKVDVIIAEGIGLRGLGLTIMDRLRKASNF